MSKVEIYTKDYCPFCQHTKTLLNDKGVKYTNFEITNDDARRQEMIERSGRTTVPQIFINHRHIGGNEELVAAQNNGLLNELLEVPITHTA